MKFSAGITHFLNKESLKRCLDSLTEFDEVIVVDGKYPHFDYPSDYSDDGSIELAESYENVTVRKLSAPEVVKRSEYFKTDADFLMQIDTDEYVSELNMDKVKRQLAEPNDYVYFSLQYRLNNNWSNWTKIYKKPINFRYYKVHTVFQHKCGLYQTHPPASKHIEGIAQIHDDKIETEKYKKGQVEYYKWLQPHERKMRTLINRYDRVDTSE